MCPKFVAFKGPYSGRKKPSWALEPAAYVQAFQVQGYLAHKKQDPTVGPCLGSYGGARGGAVSYERGNPVAVPRGRVVS